MGVTRDHDHDHEHRPGAGGGHGHGHAHGHGGDAGRAFVVGVVLNVAIVVLQVVYGVAAHSVALLADAGHNLGDVLGLVLGLGAVVLSKRKPTRRHTYGFRRATILSALANAVLLLVATGAIVWESIRRLHVAEAVDTGPVILVAAIAVVANGASALMFFARRKTDANVRAAFVHLAGDAGTSLGVIAAALVIRATGWSWVDPVVGLVVSGVILLSTWSLLRHSFNLSLDAVPAEIELDAVRADLSTLPEVCEVHDLHVWAMSTTETALTAHLVVREDAALPRSFFADVSKALHDRFGIGHVTLQVEHVSGAERCSLAADDVV